jgi:hypothetical protein
MAICDRCGTDVPIVAFPKHDATCAARPRIRAFAFPTEWSEPDERDAMSIPAVERRLEGTLVSTGASK